MKNGSAKRKGKNGRRRRRNTRKRRKVVKVVVGQVEVVDHRRRIYIQLWKYLSNPLQTMIMTLGPQ